MHPRYQPPQNGKSPMSMSMKDWKELWVQANGGAVLGISEYAGAVRRFPLISVM
jgi:hypothetical protein